MARPSMLDIKGGWCHVVNRGSKNGGSSKKPQDTSIFIGLLGAMPKRRGLTVHGYVPMHNRYHLQVETSQANLSRAIQWLNVSYSIWFNRKYERVGPLFQGGFKATFHDEQHQDTLQRRLFAISRLKLRTGIGSFFELAMAAEP